VVEGMFRCLVRWKVRVLGWLGLAVAVRLRRVPWWGSTGRCCLARLRLPKVGQVEVRLKE